MIGKKFYRTILVLVVPWFAVGTAQAEFDPFSLNCHLANNRELEVIRFQVDADLSEFRYFARKPNGFVEEGEFENFLLYGMESVAEEKNEFLLKLAERLRVPKDRIYMVSEFVMNSQGFYAYKFNSKTGELGSALVIVGVVFPCGSMK